MAKTTLKILLQMYGRYRPTRPERSKVQTLFIYCLNFGLYFRVISVESECNQFSRNLSSQRIQFDFITAVQKWQQPVYFSELDTN